MSGRTEQGPGFWRTVRLVLGAAHRRASGRRKRQRELLNQRSKGAGTDWSGLAFGVFVLFTLALNIMAAFLVLTAVASGQRVEALANGRTPVSREFLAALRESEIESGLHNGLLLPETVYSAEAGRIAERFGGSPAAIEQRLREAAFKDGSRAFVLEARLLPLGLHGLRRAGPLAQMLGSVMLFFWAAMLVFQGEGLELDTQRRRHPMWEWLFSHPAPPGAIFLAEMLAPIAANPIYWSAPFFAGILYGFIYGPALGWLAVILAGVPLSVAAACVGKAPEVGVILRFPPRSRGAIIGLMSWMGYAATMLIFLGQFVLPKVITATAGLLTPFAALPWPWLKLFLGVRMNGEASFSVGIASCWLLAAAAIAAAVWFSVWATQQGLSGNFAAADTRPAAPKKAGQGFGREPLYRKEFLWFTRDRGAIVQTILIPLTVAGVQVFNLRGLLSHAQGAWNYICGTGIIFGTYFLWVLGPKSLASEGTALWISLTWPRGLESLLKAKAWLWSLLSSALVAVVLVYAAVMFKAELWKIALVGVGWFIFGRSMAEKAVTLVAITSESGETQKIPTGRRMAAQLGMLTFAIGVFTAQWNLAVVGIVYSYATAAAMWQNFRARLPYLYDPWSEVVPQPPTLMHAMISISILVEGGAVVTGILSLMIGRQYLGTAQALGYGVCAFAVSIFVSNFISNRGVPLGEVLCWRERAPAKSGNGKPLTSFGAYGAETVPWWRVIGLDAATFAPLLLAALSGGIVLGLFAHGYLLFMGRFAPIAEILRKSQELMTSVPDLRVSYAIMAIFLAPFAEEYLFRGLLFRALDREWGGWRAIAGSAAFFAAYHPPLSWLPVGLLGAANAVLFKKTGRLWPAVLMHMVYNIIVVGYAS